MSVGAQLVHTDDNLRRFVVCGGTAAGTWMSWTDITEQGKVMSELTLTITVSTPSGKTYLKY